MANVTDEQQSRGNLGGPDLFLAPVGRLASERITKYYCNACDTEYIKPPKITFENPDEQVADNLVLVEKGQYICETCNSSIAEYREFEKPDPNAEIGESLRTEPKPTQEPEIETPIEPEPELAPVPEIETPIEPEPELAPVPEIETPIEPEPELAPVPEIETPLEPTPELETPIEPEPEQTTVDTPKPEPQKISGDISSIQGLVVYDDSAYKVGTVSQIGVSSNQSLVLQVEAIDGTTRLIPWKYVRQVGQIIILEEFQSEQVDKGEPEPITEDELEPETTPSNVCPQCDFSNASDAKFCESCGCDLAK